MLHIFNYHFAYNTSSFACAESGASFETLECRSTDDPANQGLVFCGRSASVPRGVVTQIIDLSEGLLTGCGESETQLIEDMGPSPVCSDPTNEVSYV